MPNQIVCPKCRRPQDPREEEFGRLTCPDCNTTFSTGLFGSGPEVDESQPASSALDFPASGQPRASGSITLLRSGLRSEEKSQQGGWMEGLFSRKARSSAENVTPTNGRANREVPEEPPSPRPTSRTTRLDSPPPAEEHSRPIPGAAERTDVLRRRSPTASNPHEGGPEGRVPVAGILTSLFIGAISTVALLQGRGAWANFLFLATTFLLSFALLGIPNRTGERKAFWQGFALFGWGYLAMSFTPWVDHRTSLELPTTALIGTIHARATTVADATGDPATKGAPMATAGKDDNRPREVASMFVAGDLTQFQRVGHCLFAMLAGLVGAGSARWFHRTDFATG